MKPKHRGKHYDRGYQVKHIPQQGQRGRRSERKYVVVDSQGNSVTGLKSGREAQEICWKLNTGALKPKKGERL